MPRRRRDDRAAGVRRAAAAETSFATTGPFWHVDDSALAGVQRVTDTPLVSSDAQPGSWTRPATE